MELAFTDKLDARISSSNSLLCIGLDPVPARLPSGFDSSPRAVALFCREIIEATHPYAACYKPNLAFFMALGQQGLVALDAILRSIPEDIPVILDAKVNDLGETARAWAVAVFDEIRVDALTVAPWMGEDALEPYFSRAGKGILVLVKTSNPGSSDVQDLQLASGKPLYLHVAERCAAWNASYPAHVGMVVGATYPGQLQAVRAACPDQIILLPGVGVQSGDIKGSVTTGVDSRGSGLLPSASRAIMYASSGGDFAVDAAAVARHLRDEINAYRTNG